MCFADFSPKMFKLFYKWNSQTFSESRFLKFFFKKPSRYRRIVHASIMFKKHGCIILPEVKVSRSFLRKTACATYRSSDPLNQQIIECLPQVNKKDIGSHVRVWSVSAHAQTSYCSSLQLGHPLKIWDIFESNNNRFRFSGQEGISRGRTSLGERRTKSWSPNLENCQVQGKNSY